MLHGLFNEVLDHQSGPRGGDAEFFSGMLMAMARRDFEDGDVLNFRTMLSPEPLMGPRGYPLLLAEGETANGRTPLIDRQHPHDLFMELSVSYSHRLGIDDAACSSTPACRESRRSARPPSCSSAVGAGLDPLPAHHPPLAGLPPYITEGVATAGWTHPLLEGGDCRASAAASPTRTAGTSEACPRLDSTSARVSWNPSDSLQALQEGPGPMIHSPEKLRADQLNERRWSASAIYTTSTWAQPACGRPPPPGAARSARTGSRPTPGCSRPPTSRGFGPCSPALSGWGPMSWSRPARCARWASCRSA